MKKKPEEILSGNMMLNEVPIEQLAMCNNFDLKPYGLDAWCSIIEPYRLAIFLRTKQGEERRAIQIQIPTYEEKYPEKLEATGYGLFIVSEYTKREAYTVTRINWESFKSQFITAAIELKKILQLT